MKNKRKKIARKTIKSGDLTAVEIKQRKANTDPVRPELKDPIEGYEKTIEILSEDNQRQRALIAANDSKYQTLKEANSKWETRYNRREHSMENLEKKVEEKTEENKDLKKETEELLIDIKGRASYIDTQLSENAKLRQQGFDDGIRIKHILAILKTVQSILKSLYWIAKILKGKSIGEVLKKIDAILKN